MKRLSIKHAVNLAPLCALAIGGVLFSAPEADACGGLFCSNTPVDQNAERILFEVHPPPIGVTATVEISYAGDPADFSWIVPVPETPTLDVVPVSALRLLDAATAPNIIPPPTTCNGGDAFNNRSGGFPGPPSLADAENDSGGVVVEDLPSVGAFDPEVISSEDPGALVEWLNENGYLITPAMEPFVAQYVEAGYKFLGLKLNPDAGVSDIAPIKFTCPNGDMPLVPIRLTGVSAEPEMGVLVFVAGEQRYAPQNFRNILVDTDQVQFDPRQNTSNYYPLVSWLLDNEGGKAFVTEYADSTSNIQDLVVNANIGFPADDEESRVYVADMLDTFPYLTRMYTRLSGWEMTDDPVFAPSPGGNISRTHDLSTRPPVEVCSDVFEPVPCGNTYCGIGSVCATTASGIDGCVCNDDTVARRITAPVGAGRGLAQTVTCQERSLSLLDGADIADACDGFSCGANGQCEALNGFATCTCDAGFAAVVSFNQPNGVNCAAVQSTYAPEQLLWAEVPRDFGGRSFLCACTESAGKGMFGAGGMFGLLFGLGLMLRRRKTA